jgi:hypothetical protein
LLKDDYKYIGCIAIATDYGIQLKYTTEKKKESLSQLQNFLQMPPKNVLIFLPTCSQIAFLILLSSQVIKNQKVDLSCFGCCKSFK